jgi:hypothetical protein
MARTTKQTKTPAAPGFAVEIKDDTELGLAILVAEFGDGNYQPVGVMVNINEAREIADSDMRGRMCDLERGGTPNCHERTWSGPRGSRASTSSPPRSSRKRRRAQGGDWREGWFTQPSNWMPRHDPKFVKTTFGSRGKRL